MIPCGAALFVTAAFAAAAAATAQTAADTGREAIERPARHSQRGPITLSPRPPRPTAPQIVFIAPGVPGPGMIQEIYVMNLDGSGLRQLTRDGLSKFLPHFSPDGGRIVYTKFLSGQYADPDAKTDIAVYDIATDAETRLTWTDHAISASWSPDGTRIAYGSYQGESLWIMDADGSNPRPVGQPSGASDDQRWADVAWSHDDWIYFTVGQTLNGCFNVRVDRIRPDGTGRAKVSGGGPYCTPRGREQSGDADPGISADGSTVYSSRGFPFPPPGFPAAATERKLYAFSSDAWTPGKIERNLSIPAAPDCIEGVPKPGPDGERVLLFRACEGEPAGIYLTDANGSYRQRVADGFGADWNPAASR
jgi:Tol biopolymer transport system component